MSSCLVILDGHQSHPVFVASCENDQIPSRTHRSICPVLFSPRDVPPPCFFMMPGAMSLSLDDGVLECPLPHWPLLDVCVRSPKHRRNGERFQKGSGDLSEPHARPRLWSSREAQAGGATGLHEPCCLHSLWVAIIQEIDNSVSVFGAR